MGRSTINVHTGTGSLPLDKNSTNNVLDYDDLSGFEYEGGFVTAYDDKCEFCDICDTKVNRLAYECIPCDYG